MHETTVVEKMCPRCGRQNGAGSVKCPHCESMLARQANNERYTKRDPTEVYHTERVPAPEALIEKGALGDVWVEVVPSKQEGLVHYRAEIKVTGFVDGVDARLVVPSPTGPNHGYSNLGQAIGIADAWLEAMREGLTP